MRFMLIGVLFVFSQSAFSSVCTYSTYQWDVRARKAVNIQRVVKPRLELTRDEIDEATGCSVCEEDQITLKLDGLKPFKVCKKLSAQVSALLTTLLARNAPITDVVGYRVGMTRGNVDEAGLRTAFSNHSYGVALDINTEQNGLYDNCFTFGPDCRLIKGGQWRADDPRSLRADSVIVLAFKSHGFRWGGEIAGKQKDFMHFSPSGY